MSNERRQIFGSSIKRITLCLLAVTQCGLAQAENGHEQIRQAVHSYLASFFDAAEIRTETSPFETGRHVVIEVSAIDPRLNISPCDQALSTQMPQRQEPVGRLNIKVECRGSIPWSKYVPTTVRVFDEVLTSARPLARGEIVTQGDIETQLVDLSTIRQTYIQEPDLAVGMELRRALPSGAALTQEALTAPTLVNRGDMIVMSAKTGAVEIRQQGIALQDGELGSQISVRNANSEVVVRAVVTGTGQVEVVF
ncbi:MAG: flagellar basal body P-ring formation chaperone FlgA [Pseudohongiellaceae bacterium]|nr:flagellar basal body P-ring formation chaperone FlgA [Pseudohongiellaceae bacterium]